MSMEIPRLLIVGRLVEPLEDSLGILGRLGADLPDVTSDALLQGALVMAVAAVEVALSDSLKYYLCNFPEKLPPQASVPIGMLPSSSSQLFAAAAQREVIALAYKSLPEFVRLYVEMLSISADAPDGPCIAAVQEIKATRNLALHNGTVANDVYLETAGVAARVDRAGARLAVDHAYVSGAIAQLSSFLSILIAGAREKYSKYTKIAANRALWAYMFDSPVMQYDDYWHVDEAKDSIVAYEQSEYLAALANSERLLLGVWRANFNGDATLLKGFNVHAFDSSNFEKLHFFLSIARDFPLS